MSIPNDGVSVLFEDAHLLALSKPQGMPSLPLDAGQETSLLGWAEGYLGGKAHLLHRLDRPTGGVVMIAKDQSTAASISGAFQRREVGKTYLAITAGTPTESEQTLEHRLGKVAGGNFVKVYQKPTRHSKLARLQYRVQATSEGLTLLRVRPETGRRHQIRVQLSHIGLPLLGDFKYGKGKGQRDSRLCLWAHQLELVHRDQSLSLTAPVPNAWPWNLFSPGGEGCSHPSNSPRDLP